LLVDVNFKLVSQLGHVKKLYHFQFRDAGGFESLVSGKTTEMQKIDVNERIVGLERLNPTPRPTT
jgi:hypothetical protein